MKKTILSLSCFLILSTQNLCAFGPLDNPEERHHLTASPRSVHQLKQDAHLHRMKLAKTKESFNQGKGWGTMWRTLHSLAHPLVRVSENLTSGLIAHVIVGQMLPPELQSLTCNMLGQALPLGAWVSASLKKEISSKITDVIHQLEDAAWNTFLTSVLQTSVA